MISNYINGFFHVITVWMINKWVVSLCSLLVWGISSAQIFFGNGFVSKLRRHSPSRASLTEPQDGIDRNPQTKVTKAAGFSRASVGVNRSQSHPSWHSGNIGVCPKIQWFIMISRPGTLRSTERSSVNGSRLDLWWFSFSKLAILGSIPTYQIGSTSHVHY